MAVLIKFCHVCLEPFYPDNPQWKANKDNIFFHYCDSGHDGPGQIAQAEYEQWQRMRQQPKPPNPENPSYMFSLLDQEQMQNKYIFKHDQAEYDRALSLLGVEADPNDYFTDYLLYKQKLAFLKALDSWLRLNRSDLINKEVTNPCGEDERRLIRELVEIVKPFDEKSGTMNKQQGIKLITFALQYPDAVIAAIFHLMGELKKCADQTVQTS